jgi:hypothetical protein
MTVRIVETVYHYCRAEISEAALNDFHSAIASNPKLLQSYEDRAALY